MEKIDFLVNQHGLINCEKNADEPVLHHAPFHQNHDSPDVHAEMDLLESRLFAMAGSRT